MPGFDKDKLRIIQSALASSDSWPRPDVDLFNACEELFTYIDANEKTNKEAVLQTLEEIDPNSVLTSFGQQSEPNELFSNIMGDLFSKYGSFDQYNKLMSLKDRSMQKKNEVQGTTSSTLRNLQIESEVDASLNKTSHEDENEELNTSHSSNSSNDVSEKNDVGDSKQDSKFGGSNQLEDTSIPTGGEVAKRRIDARRGSSSYPSSHELDAQGQPSTPKKNLFTNLFQRFKLLTRSQAHGSSLSSSEENISGASSQTDEQQTEKKKSGWSLGRLVSLFARKPEPPKSPIQTQESHIDLEKERKTLDALFDSLDVSRVERAGIPLNKQAEMLAQYSPEDIPHLSLHRATELGAELDAALDNASPRPLSGNWDDSTDNDTESDYEEYDTPSSASDTESEPLGVQVRRRNRNIPAASGGEIKLDPPVRRPAQTGYDAAPHRGVDMGINIFGNLRNEEITRVIQAKLGHSEHPVTVDAPEGERHFNVKQGNADFTLHKDRIAFNNDKPESVTQGLQAMTAVARESRCLPAGHTLNVTITHVSDENLVRLTKAATDAGIQIRMNPDEATSPAEKQKFKEQLEILASKAVAVSQDPKAHPNLKRTMQSIMQDPTLQPLLQGRMDDALFNSTMASLGSPPAEGESQERSVPAAGPRQN